MKNILVVGAGGIGSWLAEVLAKQQEHGQLNAIVTYCDDDKVEVKNVPYQNFQLKDVGKKKVDVMSEKYDAATLFKRAGEAEMSAYDLVVLAVDNIATRKVGYAKAKDWIDLRAEGRSVAVFVKSDKNTPKAMEEFCQVEDENASTSCQDPLEFAKNKVQYGHVVAAALGAQMVVNRVRGESVPDRIILRV